MAQVVECTECGEMYDIDFNNVCPHCRQEYNFEAALEEQARRQQEDEYAERMVEDFEDEIPLEEEPENYRDSKQYKEREDESFFGQEPVDW